MYIQITDRCTMLCEHCAFSCTRQGIDMSRRVFRDALRLVREQDGYITIGGGEPTLHPLFWDFVGLALSSVEDVEIGIHIVTNGTNRPAALQLARLARGGILSAALSRTDYHLAQERQPSHDVIAAFSRGLQHPGLSGRDSNDRRSIIEQCGDAGTPFAVGRAEEWGAPGCACDDLMVTPDGTLWECGCKIRSFGTVAAPLVPDSYFDEDERCSRIIMRHERRRLVSAA